MIPDIIMNHLDMGIEDMLPLICFEALITFEHGSLLHQVNFLYMFCEAPFQ